MGTLDLKPNQGSDSTEQPGKIRIAAVQLVSGKDLAFNIERVAHWVKEAAFSGAKVVVLPENFALLDSQQSIGLGQQECSPESPVRSELARLAREYQVWLVAGSLPCAQRGDGSDVSGRVRSACWVVNNRGEEVARYDKVHLFDVDVDDQHGQYRESHWFEPGTEAVVVDTPAGRLGLSICYDLRFPELYRRLVELGATWIVVPAAFTQATGEAHWEVLLRARAIENQVYVVAAGQGGQHSSTRITFGHSMIVDPWGSVLDCREKTGEGLVLAEIDQRVVNKVRAKMPVLKHRIFKT